MSADTFHVVRTRSTTVMVQQWLDVVYLHWSYDPAVVQATLPSGIEVDTFDGRAWVALVPFTMAGLGLPGGLAPLPHVGTFPEVNVRTYVRVGDRRGVWFYSLDVDRYLPALTARVAYRLPYCVGRSSHTRAGDIVSSSVERAWPHHTGARTSCAIEIDRSAVLDGDLELFLTERYGLISASGRGRLRWAPVDHPPWQRHPAKLLHLDDRLVAAAGLPQPTADPHVMYSPGVDVRVGVPRRLIAPARG